MQKFNKSIILKRAWSAVKSKGMSMSAALTWSWKLAKKEGDLVRLVVDRETEKAIAMNVIVTVLASDMDYKQTMWFPKSMVTNNSVPSWLFKAKEQEILASFTLYNRRASINYSSLFRAINN